MTSDEYILSWRGHTLDCRPGSGPAHVMGILNVTPDSFSDGGQYQQVDAALRRAEEMLKEGAVILDIGGESTRPRGSVYGAGAEQVALEAERARVLPVIEAVARRFPEAILSVDTYKAVVAADALGAGASMLNDVTGLRYNPEMADLAAEADVPLVVMHSLGTPGSMPHEHRYDDVVEDVKVSLRTSVEQAEAAGVRHVIVDAGFGFGKSVRENLRLVAETNRLLDLNRPVLIGISRKSTIGAVLGSRENPAPVGDRLYGTLGATAVAVLRGAMIVRTHDVRPTVECLKMLAAVEGQAWRPPVS